MWNKIYAIGLGIFTVLAAGLTYYCYNWLQSISAPLNVVQNYEYFANISWGFLWISSLILLALANVVLWTTRNAWAMWTTFLYFAIFILIQTFWLDQLFLAFKKGNGLGNNTISLGVFSGIIFCVLAAIIVFFNQFLVKRMHDKLLTQTRSAAEAQIADETNLSEKNI